MNPYSNSYKQVRGGFSLFQEGSAQGVSGLRGLGDELTDTIDTLSGGQDPTALMMGPAGPILNPSLPSSVMSAGANTTNLTTMAFVIGGVILALLVIPSAMHGR